MKAAILCEFASIRTILVQMVVIYLIVGVVVGVSIQSSIALVACIAAMTPFLAVFSLAAYDDANGWERYRACLPISRGAIVAGRYAAVLAITAFMALLAIAIALTLANAAPYLPIPAEAAASLASESDPLPLVASAASGACIILAATAVMLPFIMRYGITKATRIVPVIGFLLVVIAVPALGDVLAGTAQTPWMADLIAFASDDANLLPIVAVAVAAALALYAISCAVTMRLYSGKEL
ncbi:MAG: ABC-2 transporter permease [Eggerthellaceae bacterium]|nr:ABC-2 transporter permease [Eggerthellaceae bacterium]